MDAIPELIIIGYCNIDENIVPNHMPVILPGGAGYFVAVAASRIIKNVGFVTRIGSDFDTSFLETRVLPQGLHRIRNKIASRSIQIYYSESDFSKRDIKLLRGVSQDISVNDIPKKWLKGAKHFHVATMPPKQQKAFILFLKKYAPQATISMDTDQSLLKNPSSVSTVGTLFGLSDEVFVNRIEYTIMKSFLSRHPLVIHKEDKKGAECISFGKRIAVAKAPNLPALDTTGAGDIFAGTYLACRMKGQSIKKSLQTATAVASKSVSRPGIAHLF